MKDIKTAMKNLNKSDGGIHGLSQRLKVDPMRVLMFKLHDIDYKKGHSPNLAYCSVCSDKSYQKMKRLIKRSKK